MTAPEKKQTQCAPQSLLLIKFCGKTSECAGGCRAGHHGGDLTCQIIGFLRVCAVVVVRDTVSSLSSISVTRDISSGAKTHTGGGGGGRGG